MDKRLKELAEQAGIEYSRMWVYWTAHEPELERFADLVRQDEREACAKLCDELAMQVGNKNFIAVDQRKFCAKQIRAKGNHEQD